MVLGENVVTLRKATALEQKHFDELNKGVADAMAELNKSGKLLTFSCEAEMSAWISNAERNVALKKRLGFVETPEGLFVREGEETEPNQDVFVDGWNSAEELIGRLRGKSAS